MAGAPSPRSSPATGAATAATSSTRRSSLLAIGVAGSSAYDTVGEGRLARGESLAVGDYRLTYRALEEREAANATEVRAVLDVERDGETLGTVEAGKNAYTAERLVSNEVGIRSDLVTGEDLFVIAEQVERGRHASTSASS